MPDDPAPEQPESPWLTVIGTIVKIVGGMWATYSFVKWVWMLF